MNASVFIIPTIIIAIVIFASIKKINCYQTFVEGAKKSLALCFDIFPYLITIFFALELFRTSGLIDLLSLWLTPVFDFLGIPSELSELVLIRPFSGSGGKNPIVHSFTVALQNLFETYGADSYISRCGCVVVGSSETIFYVATIYFSKTKIKKLGYAIPLALISCLIGTIVGCLICKIL